MKNIALLIVLVLFIGLESFSQRHPLMGSYSNFTPRHMAIMLKAEGSPLSVYQISSIKNFVSDLTGEKDMEIVFSRFHIVDINLEAGTYLNSCWNDNLHGGKGGIETYLGKRFTKEIAGRLYKYEGPKLFNGEIFYKEKCGNIILIPNSLEENDEPFVERRIKPEVRKQVIVYDTIHKVYQPQQQQTQQTQQQYAQQPSQMRQGVTYVRTGVTFYPDNNYYYNNSYYGSNYYPRGWNGHNSWWGNWNGSIGRVIVNHHRGNLNTSRTTTSTRRR